MEVSQKNRKKLLLQDPYRENKLTVTKEEEGEGLNQDFGVNRHVLIYIKQINNKGLLHSTGNNIQCLVIIYNGKESDKEYIYKTESFYLKHCKSTTLKKEKKKESQVYLDDFLKNINKKSQ